MVIEIDQSGRVEYTGHDTVVAFSNGKSKAILLEASEKRVIQQTLRLAGKGNTYVVRVFSLMIFLLLREEKFTKIVIDPEYIGWETVIKNFLVGDFKKIGVDLDPSVIEFMRIGKSSEAHWYGYYEFKKKRKPELKASAAEILALLIQ